MERDFTREEFYELVWSANIEDLARQLGLSERSFYRLCVHHLIPVPPKSYWAKLAAGEVTKRTPLRKVENTALHRVQVGSKPKDSRSPIPSQTAAASKVENRSDGRGHDAGSTRPIPRVGKKPKGQHRDATKSQLDLRPKLSSFLREMRNSKPDRDGFLYSKYVKVPPAGLARVDALLTQLSDHLEQDGFMFTADGNRVGFSKEGTKVDFGITAPRKRVTTRSATGWLHHDYEHVGRLVFDLYGRASGVAKKWADTDSLRIEHSIPKIVASFGVNFIAQKEHDEQVHIAKERWARLQHRKELADLRKKREAERLELLTSIAATRREVDDLRQTIAVLSVHASPEPDYLRMIKWAEGRLAHLESELLPEKIQATLLERQLYPEPDKLHDPEGEPPPSNGYWG